MIAVAAAAPALASAQDSAPEGDPEAVTEVEEVVVTGTRPRGSVVVDVRPEVTLDPGDIRALGVANLTELLAAIEPQTRSARGREGGRPVVLLDGRRISGFAEVRRLPTEAIERVEVLPEEVALAYGYRADQRVVNVVLRERFRAVTLEGRLGAPTQGGRLYAEGEVSALRVRGEGRLSLEVEHQRTTGLLESERDLRSRAGGPFSLDGVVTATSPGGEIDPALSALAGRTVTTAAYPATSGTPTLSDFLGDPVLGDPRPYRSLTPDRQSLEVGATYATAIRDGLSATVNATADLTRSESLLGLPSATLTLPAASPFSPFASDVALYRYLDAEALRRRTDGRDLRLGFAVNGELGEDWRWTWTGAAQQTRTETRTDTAPDLDEARARVAALDPTLNPFLIGELDARGLDWSRSTTGSLSTEGLLTGSLVDLPAGPVRTSARAQLESRRLDSVSLRDGEASATALGRDRAGLSASVDVPIASRRREALDALGDLSLNLNAEAEELSDFGGLYTFGAGVNWSPVSELDFLVSYTLEQGAPTVAQLGDPVIETPRVTVFDYVTGQTVEATVIEGGDPSLRADERSVFKIGATWRPAIEDVDLSVTGNYVVTRTDDPVYGFPTVTAELQAAFPERFERDGEGRLIRLDSRPVNFARSDREEFRWGFDLSKTLQPTEAERREAEAARARREALRAEGQAPGPDASGGERSRRFGPDGRGGGGSGGPGFGRGGGQGRLQLSLFHTWRLRETVLIRNGLPEIDLLDGGAIGSQGGESEHLIDLQAGYNRNGLGARLNARWRSGTEVASGASGAEQLTFSDLATVDLRLFADLSARRDWVRRYPWMRGARVTLAVENLFDEVQDVRDASGQTPIGYQPAYLDAAGRTVTIGFRKLLF